MNVTPESWYADAIAQAAARGIVGGYGNGMLGPNDSITREQLAVMLWRYAGSPAATDKELHFTLTCNLRCALSRRLLKNRTTPPN